MARSVEKTHPWISNTSDYNRKTNLSLFWDVTHYILNNTKELFPENGEPPACWLVVNEFAHLVALPPMATTLSSLSGHVATVGELAQILHLS